MELDLTAAASPTLSFSDLAGDAVRETALPGARGGSRRPQEYYGFVSLYNRGASFTIVEALELQ
jgi:hypothetical protein